jgi:hypothetical protein
MNSKAKILLLYTGGTIECAKILTPCLKALISAVIE